MKTYEFEIETPSGAVTTWRTKATNRVSAWQMAVARFGHTATCIRMVTHD